MKLSHLLALAPVVSAGAAVLRSQARVLRRALTAESSVARFDLDLADLRVGRHDAQSLSAKGGNTLGWGAYLVNGTVRGKEVACLSCPPKLFAMWLQQLQEPAPAVAWGDAKKEKAAAVHDDKAGKHPGSPGYEEWAAKQKRNSLLARASNETRSWGERMSGDAKSDHVDGVTITHFDSWSLEEMRPRLQALWNDRRLVVGQARNPNRERMDFVEALVSLARESPALTAADCKQMQANGEVGLPHCDSLFSGERTASSSELRVSLEKAFGASFLKQHQRDPKKSPEEERKSVQALLKALKSNYTFYYQKCLNHEPGTESCDRKAPSDLVGQMACAPHDDEPSDDCVYAELRLCKACSAHSGGRFFEYSRFHGPLALFETKESRGGLMGQCEEFSRAGHALLSSLGYEARYILDFTDHVWIEIKLPSGPEGKWTHADPSEGVLDQPLMYEKGWGKKLTMIFAFTPTYMEHVTRTYTASYNLTAQRRGISEPSLDEVVSEANERLRFELPKTKWGFGGGFHSQGRNIENIALWSHFEGASLI